MNTGITGTETLPLGPRRGFWDLMASTGTSKVCIPAHSVMEPLLYFNMLHGCAGNDDPNSPYNTFTVECLDYMGKFSQLAKEQDNYVVSMAPAGMVERWYGSVQLVYAKVKRYHI
jgi:hypothetical protein